jgi:hypothetical protein
MTINNTVVTDLEQFIKELQSVNSEYFLWLKASGQLEVGKGYSPPNVFVLNHNGTFSPAKVRMDCTLGVLIEPKE